MFFDSDANAGTVKPMGVSPPEAAVYLLLIIWEKNPLRGWVLMASSA